MSYAFYDNMSTKEKDKIAEGTELKELSEEYERKQKQQHQGQDNIKMTPKRRRHEDNENEIIEMDQDSFQMVQNKNKNKKTRSLVNPEEQNILIENTKQIPYPEQKQNERRNNNGRSMIIFNSRNQNERYQKENQNSYELNQSSRNKKNVTRDLIEEIDTQHQSQRNVTHQALQYAVGNQLPPLKISCNPAVKNHTEGSNIIKELFSQMKNDFIKQNKLYNRPIGFDTWYIDKQGSLLCFTKEIELFVYLWDTSNYPLKILNTIINPIPPTHLPPQHSIILKFVPSMIATEEIEEAISDICQSKILIAEMKGSMTTKSRHIRIDITSKDEVRKLLNSGYISVGGYLIEVDEFLAPPQILICSRCNKPGHIKKQCNETYDKCRRCGLNKLQGDHLQCVIKCHHCNEDHLATDYRCPIIIKYRRDLIDVLRKKPELLPQNVQLFIPVEFRNGGKNTIGNAIIKNTASPYVHNPAHTNAWPPLQQMPLTTNINECTTKIQDDMIKQIDVLQKDYEHLKQEFMRKENELTTKHNNYKVKLGAMLNLLVLQNNQQNESINKIYTVVNELVPIVADSLKAMHMCTAKTINSTNDSNLQKEYRTFQLTLEQGLNMLNDRNDLIIEHQRSTISLTEKTNDLFRQGIELMSLNEQGTPYEKKRINEILIEWNSRISISSMCKSWMKERPTVSSENLTFIVYNVEGLNMHITDIDILINNYRPHLFMLTGVGTATRNLPTFQDYSGVAQSGSNSYGGVAILYNSKLKLTVIEKEENFLVMEMLLNSEIIKVGAIYVPPSSYPPFHLLSKYTDHPFIFCGDFNAKHVDWNCIKNNTSGNQLAQWIENSGVEIINPGKATSRRSEAIIDFGITNDASGWQTEDLILRKPTGTYLPLFYQFFLTTGTR
ncbi:unnamed protein product [Rotaria socialis]